jgi:GAF domain-containing protein
MEAAASQIGLTLANAELAEQTRRHLAATRAIGEVARIGATAGVQATLNALVRRVRELTEADAALVYLVGADPETFYPAAESLTAEAEAAQIGRITGPQRRVGTGMVGWVIASGEAAFVPDLSRDPRSSSHHLTPSGEAAIVVPMRSEGKVIGCLRVSLTGGRRFTESDLWLIQTMADEASLAIESVSRQQAAQDEAHLAGQRAVASAVLEAIGEPMAVLRKASATQSPDEDRSAIGRALSATERMETSLRKLTNGTNGHEPLP